MNFESELAELDDGEYRKLKRVIVKSISKFKGLDEKEKLKLLAGWIDYIKEERKKKTEVLVVNEEAKEELKKEAEVLPEEVVVEEPSRFNWKMVFGIIFLVLLLLALVFASFNLFTPSGKVKFVAVKDYSVVENDSLTILLVAKHANNYSAQNLPAGAVFVVDKIIWTPNFSQSGSYLLKACAFNNISSDCVNISVKVKDKNLAPKLVSVYPKSRLMWIVGKPLIFFVNASDFDNDSLTYSWSLGGIFGKKVVDGNAVKMTFGSVGKRTVKVQVSDGEFSVDYEWIVEVINPSPAKKTTSYIVSGAVVADQDVVSYIIDDKEPAIRVNDVEEVTEKSYVIGDGAEKAIQVEMVGDETSNSYILNDESIKVVGAEVPKSAEFRIP